MDRTSAETKLPDLDQFYAWLERESGLGHRSLSDVCSRLRRLARLVDFRRIRSVDDLTVAMIKGPEFKTLPTSVRSQLKRAGGLYLEFGAKDWTKS